VFDSFWILLAMTFAMVLVSEGILPFLSPKKWRQVMLKFTNLSDQAVRMIGLASMLAGTVIMIGIHHIIIN